MRYVCAIGSEWGISAFANAAAAGGQWASVRQNALLATSIALQRTRYVFFLNWSGRVPDAIVGGHECVNFHCTALPYGRGGHPIENLILRGHTETIITAHRMTSEMDAGPIYGTRGPIGLAGTKAEIQQRFVAPVAELMRWIVETEPEPKPQEGEPVLFKRLPPEDYKAFWGARA